MANLKYDSNNTLLNVGSLFWFGALKLVLIILYAFLYLIYNNLNTKLQSFVIYLKKLLVFNGLLILIQESFLENLISAYLGFKFPLNESFKEFNGEKVSYYLSFACFGLNTIFMICVVWVNTLSEEKISQLNFKEKWSCLTEELRDDKLSRSFNIIFTVRRLFCFFIIFQLIYSDTLQIITMYITNVLIFAYVGAIEPKKTKFYNWVEQIHEFSLLLICSLLPAFTLFV